ncbi:MAG: hypothetical protein HUK02_02965 [Bacteroidaceae bacterium]|nr:hypothetical protein [Bacteroidaceae bacterium]
MMKEEDILTQRAKENPFRTPEGYFEQFDQRLMERLPRKRRTSWLRRAMPYAAAVVLVAGAAGTLYWQANRQQTLAEAEAQTEYMNEMLDYSLVDNMEIAEYLTEAY